MTLITYTRDSASRGFQYRTVDLEVFKQAGKIAEGIKLPMQLSDLAETVHDNTTLDQLLVICSQGDTDQLVCEGWNVTPEQHHQAIRDAIAAKWAYINARLVTFLVYGYGRDSEAKVQRFLTLEEAREEVERRLGDRDLWRKWSGGEDDVEAYHVSRELECGGVAIAARKSTLKEIEQ